MIEIEHNKERTDGKAIERLPAPEKVYLPLSQHLGKPCIPEVKPGDHVILGQRIASVQAHVYAPIHASVSGTVVAVQEWPHPVLGRAKAIVVENDGEDAEVQTKDQRSQADVDALTPEEVRAIVREAGIVGMGGASFPTYIKLTPPKPVDTLIINGAECEPYLTSDSRLMTERAREIILGALVIRRCLQAERVLIAIEDNKPLAIGAVEEAFAGTRIQLRVLRSGYPQGGEKQLIKNVLGREVPRGKLPFDVGVVVHNVATAFAVYEAVYLGKPLYERVVTVTGPILANPKNLLVRLGTPLKDLLAFCGPLTEEPAKLLAGGPMMGIAQYSDEAPVIKSTGGVLAFGRKDAALFEEEFCIRCGACVKKCPVGLMPCLINLASEKGLWEEAKKSGALDCIECGVCSFVCPARRNLVQSIKRAKVEASK